MSSIESRIEELKSQLAELQKQMITKQVIVRTYSAGVHFGELAAQNGTEVILKNARRIWEWGGAFTLSAVATTGTDSNKTSLSVAVPEILLTQAIEIIPLTVEAAENLNSQPAKKI
jgi:alpha-tubulin suppressor-like RCC1 family protein